MEIQQQDVLSLLKLIHPIKVLNLIRIQIQTICLVLCMFIELILLFVLFISMIFSQFQFNSSDGTLYTGTNSFFQPQTSVI